jgi:cellulose synthase/poly-beta-1,6-N-acetylglucosamine synthase-like glycosyltransferase
MLVNIDIVKPCFIIKESVGTASFFLYSLEIFTVLYGIMKIKKLSNEKLRISILIPSHNEDKGLKKCLESVFRQKRSFDQVVVVNDGSTDTTRDILANFTAQHEQLEVVHLIKNSGNKSKAQEAGLPQVKGDILVMTDADTILHENFVAFVEKQFVKDTEKKMAAVAGYVQSIQYNWLTACREIDYVIGFDIFKQAQSCIGYVFVMPGCATAIRLDVLKNLSFHHDTVTEDLDFTYQIHKKGLGIVFERDAIVYTQDPPNLASYIRQMKRWYGGGWQNFIKYYQVALMKPAAALELSLMLIDGFFYSLFLFVLMLFYPVLFATTVLPLYLLISFVLAFYASVRRKRLDLVLVFPLYLLIAFLNAGISLQQFFVEVVLRKKSLIWHRADRV